MVRALVQYLFSGRTGSALVTAVIAGHRIKHARAPAAFSLALVAIVPCRPTDALPLGALEVESSLSALGIIRRPGSRRYTGLTHASFAIPLIGAGPCHGTVGGVKCVIDGRGFTVVDECDVKRGVRRSSATFSCRWHPLSRLPVAGTRCIGARH